MTAVASQDNEEVKKKEESLMQFINGIPE